MSDLTGAEYIWIDPQGLGRNRFVLFRRTFTLPGSATGASLRIFADTRYRLIVNGHVIGHGPARFYPSHPCFSTYASQDLVDHLHPGENVLAVIINSYGTKSFHSHVSRGGLIATCDIETADGVTTRLVTDGGWRCLESPGHVRETPHMTFALNPAENVDLAKMPAGWDAPGFDDSAWSPAVGVDDPGHWGPLRESPIPLLDESPVRPAERVGLWAGAMPEGEDVYSLVSTYCKPLRHGESAATTVTTQIHSPTAQRVTLGAWWGRYLLNGVELEGRSRDDVHLRQDFDADLEAGWNTLEVRENSRGDVWEFFLAVPRGAGLTVAADRDLDCDATFLVGDPPVRWPRDAQLNAPCREHAWKAYRPIEAVADVRDGETLVMLFDFGREVLGRPRLDFTAAKGTTVDLAYTERRHDDGLANIHGRFLVDMVERCQAADGRQTFQTFHPRGFRYLEVSVTGGLDAFELHDLDVTGAYYPVAWDGAFDCSDERLNRIWEIGRQALHNCMEDAYLDCPWRERGVYVGDALVEYDSNLPVFGDHALMRRTVEIFLQSQDETDPGLVRAGAFEIQPGRHPDYSAILLQCGRRYIEETGDETLASEYVDRWLCVLEAIAALRVEGTDLFDGSDISPYVDIAKHDCRNGVNCALNAFYQKAFVDGAWLLERIGRPDEAKRWADLAEKTAAAIREAFWDDERGVFVDRLRSDVPDTEPSIHGNTLAVLYDIATDAQTERLATWFAAAMADNFCGEAGPPERNSLRVNAYFSYYALGALYKLGRADEALDFMRTCWGHMLNCGAWATWESFGGDREGSLCHAWAACPCWYLSTQVLGVTFPDPDDRSRVRIDPHPGDLTGAAGVYPHRLGPIRVSWTAADGTITDLHYEVPAGVTVERAD